MILRSWLIALGLLIAAIPLAGAINPRPVPVVVIYPLTTTAGTNPDAGSNIAILFSNRMAQAGGITVKPPTPGTTRADFLTAALNEHADYYVTGYLTPLGDDVSMLAQVVSTYSGTIVFSTTVVVRTYAEAGGQADLLREAILRHAGRGLAELDETPPPSTPEPRASERPHEGTLANITSVFHHTKKTPEPSPAPSGSAASVAASRPSPSPAPVATAAASAAPSPARVAAALHGGAMVLAVTGGQQSDEARVADALVSSLKHRGVNAMVSSASIAANPADNAAQLCARDRGVSVLYAGTLSIERNSSGAADTVQLDVVGYDCAGNPILHENGEATVSGKGGVNSALDRAADAAAAALARRTHSTARLTVPADLRAAT